MNYHDLIDKYTQALGSNNYPMIVSLFEPDAIIDSPLLGQNKVHDFYRKLFEKFQYKNVTLKQLFSRTFNPFWVLLRTSI